MLRSTALIDAPPRTVAGLLRDVGLSAAALRGGGHRVEADVRLLAPGAEIRLGVVLLPGLRVAGRRVPGLRVPGLRGLPAPGLRVLDLRVPALRVPVRMRVEVVSDSILTAAVIAGPLPELTRTITLTPTAAGTLVLDELRWTTPLGPLGRVLDVVLGRRLVLRAQAATLDALALRAAAQAGTSVVVATALHRDGRLLIAQRTRPEALAGRWELPGGRVEAGESEPDAVRRECLEELAVPVTVTGRLGTDLPIDGGVLRVHVAELAAHAQQPQPLEHAALRWVGPRELAEIDWVDADRAVLADLLALLTGSLDGGEGAATG